jgi:hypothetical protein
MGSSNVANVGDVRRYWELRNGAHEHRHYNVTGKASAYIPASLSSRRKATQGRPKGISFFFYTLIRVVLIRDGTAAGR